MWVHLFRETTMQGTSVENLRLRVKSFHRRFQSTWIWVEGCVAQCQFLRYEGTKCAG